MTTAQPLPMPRDWTMTMRRLTWAQTTLLGIGIVALALRLTGIIAGLPAALFNDEGYLVANALRINWNDLDPHTFVWGSLPFYIVRLVTALTEPLVRLFAGHGPTYSDYYLAVRLLSTGFNLGTMVLVYAIASRLAGRLAGIAAAWLFAIAPYMVELSHYASIETMLTFWTALTLYGLVLWNGGEQRGRTVAALAAGLAMATKYSALLLLLPIAIVAIDLARRQGRPVTRGQQWLIVAGAGGLLLAVLSAWLFRDPLLRLVATWTNTGTLKPMYYELYDRILAALVLPVTAGWLLVFGVARRWRWSVAVARVATSRQLILPVLFAVTVFLLAEPFALLDFPAFTQGAAYDLAQQDIGPALGFDGSLRSLEAASGQLVAEPPFYFYVRAIGNEWGTLAAALMLPGLWFAWRKNPTVLTALSLWLLIVLLSVSLGQNRGLRYLAPAWNLLAILGGAGIAVVVAALGKVTPLRWRQAVIALVMVTFISIVPLNNTRGLLNTVFLRDDTRNLAYAWITSHIAPGTQILRENGLTPDRDTPPIEALTTIYRVNVEAYLFEKASLTAWHARGFEWLIISDSRQRFYQSHAVQFQDVLAEYDALARSGAPAVSFRPNDTTKGPPIYIYELR